MAHKITTVRPLKTPADPRRIQRGLTELHWPTAGLQKSIVAELNSGCEQLSQKRKQPLNLTASPRQPRALPLPCGFGVKPACVRLSLDFCFPARFLPGSTGIPVSFVSKSRNPICSFRLEQAENYPVSSKGYPSRFESRAGFFASTRDECLSPRNDFKLFLV